MTGLQLAGGLLGSSTLTGSTVTTSQPLLNLAQTWNAGAVTFTGWKLNVTDTASASASLLMDLQVGGSSKFSVKKDGTLTVSDGSASAPSIVFSGATNTGIYQAGGQIAFSVGGSLKGYFSASSNFVLSGINILDLTGTNSVVIRLGTSSDLILSRPAAATLQLGNADAAAPVAQTLGVQSVVAGTTNTAGANFTIKGSAGTGTGAGGSIIFQVAAAGSSGTSQNSFATALTIASDKSVAFAAGNASFGPGTTSNFLRFTQGSPVFELTLGTISLVGNAVIEWGSQVNTFAGSTPDLTLRRDAANTLALRNSTSAQTMRVYVTADGSPGSNYRRTAYDGEGIYLEGLGSGLTGGGLNIYNRDNGPIYLATNNTGRWTISASGNLLAQTDNNYDIGTSGNNRPRNIYTGGFAILGSYIQPSYVRLAVGGNEVRIYQAGNGVMTLYNAAETDFNRIQLGGTTSSFPALKRVSANLQVIAADNAGSAGFIVGNQALATNATDGFLYIPTCAGTPTGTPTAQTGTAPLVVDSTNNKLYVYVGGAWVAMN